MQDFPCPCCGLTFFVDMEIRTVGHVEPPCPEFEATKGVAVHFLEEVERRFRGMPGFNFHELVNEFKGL